MKKKVFNLMTLGFWKSYLIHMRPYLFFISGFAGMSGIALTKANLDLNFWIVLIPFFLSYGFGQALTDCFQIDTDKISSPYRPLSQGIIRRIDVLGVSVVGLVVCILILCWFNPYNLIFGILSFGGLATYSYIKRHFWALGPAYNSLIVSFLPLMGYLSFTKPVGLKFNEEVIRVALILFFSYSIFVLMGYLKDISADRQAKYHTFPVVWGWNLTVWVSDLIYLLVLVGIYLSGYIFGFNWFLYGLAIVLALLAQLKAHFQKVKTEEYAAFSIACSIRFFIICCFIIIYSFKPSLWFVLVLGAILFEYTLRQRPEKAQL